MDESVTETLLSKLRSPKGQLELLRGLMAFIAVFTSLLYPWALLAAIMASDSGTATAMRVSYLSLFGFTFYVFAIVFSAIKWSDWPLASAILLVPIALANIAALIFIPFIAARIVLFPLGFLGVDLPETTYTILGGIMFGLIFVLAPVLSIWRLFRHAFDMDIPPLDQPVEIWDLMRLNSR